jgi:hypothetical protein
MTRTQLTGYALLAAAFVQGAVLLACLQDRLPQAHAELVVTRDNISMMTSQTRTTEESLFILDQSSGRLLVYNCDLGQKRIDLAGAADLGALFGQVSDSGSKGGRTGGGR